MSFENTNVRCDCFVRPKFMPKPGNYRYASESRCLWVRQVFPEPSSRSSPSSTVTRLTISLLLVVRVYMATPSSSATSPSPPMAYLHHIPGAQQALHSGVPDTLERDQRKQAIDKFLARAEIAMVSFLTRLMPRTTLGCALHAAGGSMSSCPSAIQSAVSETLPALPFFL